MCTCVMLRKSVSTTNKTVCPLDDHHQKATKPFHLQSIPPAVAEVAAGSEAIMKLNGTRSRWMFEIPKGSRIDGLKVTKGDCKL